MQEHQDQHLELDILQVGVVVLNIEIKVLQVLDQVVQVEVVLEQFLLVEMEIQELPIQEEGVERLEEHQQMEVQAVQE